MDRNKGLLGIKQPKLSPGQQKEEQNGRKAIRVYMSGGWWREGSLVVVNDKDLGN